MKGALKNLVTLLALFPFCSSSLVAVRQSLRRCSRSTVQPQIRPVGLSSPWSLTSVPAIELHVTPTKKMGLSQSDFDKDKDEVLHNLIPEENPTADPTIKSRSGVSYMKVLNAINKLYPPQDLEKRNAMSRSDGYWPFVNNGKDPPKQYTYGEFDFYFFAELLDKAHDYYYRNIDYDPPSTWEGKVFADIGSGTGRLVLAAAALHPEWKLCRGLEVLESISAVAVETLERCRIREETRVEKEEHYDNNDDETEWRAPFGTSSRYTTTKLGDSEWINQLQSQFGQQAIQDSEKECDSSDESDDMSDAAQERVENVISETVGDNKKCAINETVDSDRIQDNAVYCLPASESPASQASALHLAPIELSCGSFDDPYEYFGDVDCVFCFSSCMSPELMSKLSRSIGRQCEPGTIVITTEYMLPLDGVIEPLEDDESMPSGPYKLELLEKIDGWCWLMGGQSTAYIHRVVQSLWEEDVGKRLRPELSLEERAFRVVKAMEAGELTDTKKFLLQVHNNILFYNLPESWRPKLDDV